MERPYNRRRAGVDDRLEMRSRCATYRMGVNQLGGATGEGLTRKRWEGGARGKTLMKLVPDRLVLPH